ncbi:MAG: hypothetical protein K6G73_12965 [Marinilabiliaceae bacterium]|nr:hypothetical protein [Marinilabiliaceae bacterium]
MKMVWAYVGHPERSEGSLSLGVGCAYTRAKSKDPALHIHFARTDNTDNADL